eukprot:jgi/Botrbrau1/17816/Bobra.0127s0061.1
MERGQSSSPFRWVPFVITVTAYLGLNSALNLCNKYFLGPFGFSFPILLTCSHMMFGFVALLPLMLSEKMRQKHEETLEKQWKGIVAIGLYMALNISLNNSSLVDMTLSLNQIIRASIPVFTCVLAVVVENKVPTKGEAVSLIVLTLGVMIAVWEGTVQGSPRAILLCIGGTISNAAMMTTSGKVLSERVDALRLTFYTAPVSLLALLPAFYLREYEAFSLNYLPAHRWETLSIVGVTSVIALAYNVVHSLMIQQTSAVTTTVLGEAKIVGLMFLSYVLLGEKKSFTTNMTVGCITAMVGFFLYSHFKLEAARHAALSKVVGEVQLEDSSPLLKTQVRRPSKEDAV